MPTVELWQAVCLSLNLEPEERLKMHAVRSSGQSKYVGLPTDFWDRLMVCQARVSYTHGPIHPQGTPYPGMLDSPTCPVLQAEVAAFLVSVGLEVPEEMRPAKDAEAQKPEGAGGESLQQRAARRYDRFLALGGKLKRAGDSWHAEGTRGALATLVQEEQAAGTPRSDKSDLRQELHAEHERRLRPK